MSRRSRIIATVLGCGILVLAVFYFTGAFGRDYWTREHPLVSATAVAYVKDGKVTLADGRTLTPAGIARDEAVPPADYDAALRTACAQGVVVIRDLGDGRAFLRAEPKFYNWCGTRDGFGSRWAGGYFQAPLSELLIYTRYAKPRLDEPALTAIELWRLEGVEHFAEGQAQTHPKARLPDGSAFSYDGNERMLEDCDQLVEMMWQPPP